MTMSTRRLRSLAHPARSIAHTHTHTHTQCLLFFLEIRLFIAGACDTPLTVTSPAAAAAVCVCVLPLTPLATTTMMMIISSSSSSSSAQSLIGFQCPPPRVTLWRRINGAVGDITELATTPTNPCALTCTEMDCVKLLISALRVASFQKSLASQAR